MKQPARIKVAKVISGVLNPLLLPLFVFGYCAHVLESDVRVKFVVISIGVFFFSILPLLILLAVKRRHKLSSIDIPIREDRTRPFLYGILSMLTGSAMFIIVGLQNADIYQALALISVLNAIMAAVITVRWKISIHAISITSAAVIIYFMSGGSPLVWPQFYGTSLYLVISFAVLIGLVLWSRVVLKHHTPAQVILGTIFGIVFTTLQLLIYFPVRDFDYFT